MARLELEALSDCIADIAETAAPLTLGVDGGARPITGFHWKDGLYVSSEESVEGEDEVAVTLASGARVSAVVKGRDPSTGIVLLAPEGGRGIATIERARGVRAGSLVVVAGRHGGTPLAALGTVCEAGQPWRSMRGGRIDARITLAAPVDGRFEGGPVLDASGALVGMMLFGPRRKPLVIPAATIDRIAPVLAEKGCVSRGYLGAGLNPMRSAGIRGAMVMSLEKDGPAAAAGVMLGDIVTSWNGEAIAGPRDMLQRLGPDSAGLAVKLGISRGGEARTVDITIGSKPLA